MHILRILIVIFISKPCFVLWLDFALYLIMFFSGGGDASPAEHAASTADRDVRADGQVDDQNRAGHRRGGGQEGGEDTAVLDRRLHALFYNL